MSVNITVSGKFAKHCNHPLLVDPQDAKKAEEKERRKLRLLQVREESKKLAKRIRDEVNEEKKKELQKLQDIKEKELECWRQHALQRKGEEYRAAIFQVGTAHEAARKENQERSAKQNQPQGTYKEFKKQMVARKSQPERVKFNCLPSCSCQQTDAGANKHWTCTCTKAQDKSESTTEDAQKRKRDWSFSTSDSEYEDEGYKEQTLPQSSISLSSTCDSSTLSTCDKNYSSKNSVFMPKNKKCLIRTPSVFLDVEVGSDNSVTINAPVEVKDKHCKYNRQFSSVIRLSPRREHNKKENTSENTCTQPSSITTVLSSDTTAKDQNKNKSFSEISQNNQYSAVKAPKEKRFTIISELVKKQQENESVTENRAHPLSSQTTSASAATHVSPKKQLKEIPVRPPISASVAQSPRKTSAASKSSRTLSAQPLASVTTAAKSNSAAVSTSSSSGRVQFYDYNSKLAREREQSATAVTIQRQRDQTLPSAMEQAELENQKERERQLEELKKHQQMEERGHKALEREQIRRDCKELTEKLEVLSQEYAKQLPTNDNQLHIFADKQLRKEGKMNLAIEKLLQRPSIITCPEQNKQCSADVKQNTTRNVDNLANILNVASSNKKSPLGSDDLSSDSCCSILLGYVDDQSKLIKQDMQKSETSQNRSKQKRLKELLKRLDSLRFSLLEELKKESKLSGEAFEKNKAHVSSKEDNLKQVIDSISELRKEHEEIIINDKDVNSKSLREREKLLKAKEEILERKVREFFELQSQSNKVNGCYVNDKINQKTDNGNAEVCATGEKPLEIVITVKGDSTKCVSVPGRPKKKTFHKKAASTISTLIKSPQLVHSKVKKHTPKKKPQSSRQLLHQGMLKRQNSYDSNSTSYMSLPAEMPTKINDLAQAIAKQAHDQKNEPIKVTQTVKQATPAHTQQQETESSSESSNITQPPRVNPLIAQYVQRLLGMSRSAVQNLGVSSSELETPNSSIIHTPDNIAVSQNIISEERLKALQNFVEENKSFIEDLEQSIRSQNNVSLENSLRKLDDIWRKRLKNEKKNVKKSEGNLKKAPDYTAKQKPSLSEKNKISKEVKTQQPIRLLTGKGKPNDSTSNLKENFIKDLSKSLSSHCSSEEKESGKSIRTIKRSIQTVDKAVNAKLSTDSSKTESDSQIARYAKLTENCTHRIAELTTLINRVREEKQRLLEVTLSSVSDNGRHSTEYLELPEGKTSTRTEQDNITPVSSSAEETTQNKQSLSSNALPEMVKLTSADKNKQLANSRDSGIADSRPVTSLENRYDQEPPSQTSSESTQLPQATRKLKPPPTLKRFSPQLPDDELAHELSTIFEVDTPATSRINTAIGQSADDKENGLNIRQQKPTQFPTFEQYIEKFNLDITQLNAEQSLLLQHEFAAFVECLKSNRSSAEAPRYSEFPSIASYIQQLAECDVFLGENLEESLAKLHISSINPDNFPAVRDYIRHAASKTLQSDTQQLLDTESLENITDAPTQTNTDIDTASVDFQEELKKRNIIKNSFRVSERRKKRIFSSTAQKDEEEYNQDMLVAESGIEKLSTSDNTTELLDNDVKSMVRRWSRETRKISKGANILSSTTTSTNASSLANSALRAASAKETKKESGHSFNLRDFLIRELEKNASNSGSTTSSSNDDSLRNYFLHSLLGSLTPYTPGAASKSGGHTLDRQKTSTPVPVQSTQAHSTVSSHSKSSSQLFSGESRLSSVHYQNRTEHLITSGDNNADQSSE